MHHLIMYTALIVDEAAATRGSLRHQLERFCSEVTTIVEADCPETARDACMGHRFDVAFIDTHLRGQPSGLAFAELARHCIRHLVFVTDCERHALAAFRARAFDYLLKPVARQELRRIVRELRPDRPAGSLSRITLTDRGRLVVLEENHILHVVGSGSYATIHSLHEPPITVCQHLGKFCKRLRSDRFVRIHQSHLVNLDYLREINTVDGYTAILTNGERIPVAKRQKSALLASL